MSDKEGKLVLTPWGEFVMRYSVMVPPRFWQEVRYQLQHTLNMGDDWKFLAKELVAGLNALMDDEGRDSLYRIVNLEEGG